MIYEYFRVFGAHEAVLDFPDLVIITFHGDDVQDCVTRCDQVMLSTNEVRNDIILESLYKMRMRESDQLKKILVTYEQAINQERSKPSYQKLKTMVKRQKDQKIRIRNFRARNERIEAGVLVKTQK